MNIRLLLLFVLMYSCSVVHAQHSKQYYERLLQQYKEISVNSNAERSSIISAVDKDMSETDYPDVRRDFQKFKDDLNALVFVDTKASNSVDILDKTDLRGLEVKHDKFDGVTIIKPNSDFLLSPYIILTKDSDMLLRLKIHYRGNGWIFMDKATFLINGTPIEYQIINATKRETTGSRIAMVKETSDDVVNNDLLNILRSIADSNIAIEVKLSGDKYTIDTINKKNIERVRSVLMAFDKLK